jgi:hypothetical protein
MVQDWRSYNWWVGLAAKCSSCGHTWKVQESDVRDQRRADGGIAIVIASCPRCDQRVGLSHPGEQ